MNTLKFLLISLALATSSYARDIEPHDDLEKYIHMADPGYFTKPVMPHKDASLTPVSRQGDFWAEDWVQHWTGEQLEGSTPYCKDNSYRSEPETGFDINKDGYSEILFFISCYQGEPIVNSEKHNRAVRAAWKMFCSDHYGQYSDCTQELFDTNEIEATITPDSGGIPYMHVADTGYDINNDGFPDFWYGLSRDDGRQMLDPNDPADRELFYEFCDPDKDTFNSMYNCTIRSVQSALLSYKNDRNQLKYKIVQLPWGEVFGTDIVALPNQHSTVDLYMPGEPVRAARLTDNNEFVDVSSEYSTYKNIRAITYSSNYIHTFEYLDTHYYVTAGVQRSVLENPNAGNFDDDFEGNPSTTDMGFTLWRWIPGKGFELSDFYTPPEMDRFSYKHGEPGNYQIQQGVFLKDIPVYYPQWHFFAFAQLTPDEPPVLITSQEAGSTFGIHFGAEVDANKYYDQINNVTADYSTSIGPLSVVQAFYIRNGKLVAREQSVINGDVVWSLPSIRFQDLNRDGYTDMYGTSGHEPTGRIYLNDGSGTLNKVDTSSIWPYHRLERAWNGGYGGVIRNLGMAPYLHFIQFGLGMITPPMDWPEYANGYVHPDIIIHEALLPVDELPVSTPQDLQDQLHQCVLDFENQWFYNCFVY